MIIYHGHPSPASIESCRAAAPSHTHGAEWSPLKMTPHDWPYILDNGAFRAFKRNEPWDVDAFAGRLGQLDTMPRDPDFVVLPDVVTNPEKTKKRASQWAGAIGYPTAYPAQDGVTPEEAVEIAEQLGCDTVFLGGTVEWKREVAHEFVDVAHDHGLRLHIGRPGNLVWARDTGADSVDTTSVVQDQAWHKLETLESAPMQGKVGMF